MGKGRVVWKWGFVVPRTLLVLGMKRFNDNEIWDVGPVSLRQDKRVGWECKAIDTHGLTAGCFAPGD